MKTPDLGFVHRYIPAPDSQRGPTLLLLHGTGGDETDLLELGRSLAPGAALLSPRGKVLEHGMARFFRRFAEGVFDVADLKARTHELAGLVQRAADAYGFDIDTVIAVGYSNGANIAASLLLLHPGLLRAAVLLRAMVPFEPEAMPKLAGTSVFLAAGRMDQMIPPSGTERLAELLRSAGADVDLRWQNTGHGLTNEELEEAKAWLSEVTEAMLRLGKG